MADVPVDEIALLYATVCRAVNDPKRIQILYVLNQSPHNVTELADLLTMPQPTVSRHLGVLRQAGVVDSERQGTSVIYSLASPLVVQILDLMRQLMRDVMKQQSDMLE
jgi:DNA-binding transcriptional ArsR family regulator